jgi:type I restriction enzyme S subunit
MQDILTRGIDEHGNLRTEQTHKFKDSPLGKIPVEWEVKKIKDVAEVSYGISDAINVMNKSGVPTITLPCVSPNGNLTIDPNKLVYTPRKAVKERDFLQLGDLLFNWRNGSQNHLGKTAYFNASGRLTHVGFLLKIRTFESKCDSRFLWYLINDIKEKGFFLSAKIQVNNTFNSNELRAVELTLPPITEQKLVCEKLDALENATSDFVSELKKFKILKTALMQDLLTGKKRVTALLHAAEVPAS